MKIVLLIVIVTMFIYIGVALKNNFKNREKLLYEITLFLKKLEGDIGFLQKNLLVIVNEYKTDNKNFAHILKVFKTYLNNGNSQELKNKLNYCSLKEEEKNQLLNFFESVGKGESTSEIYKIKNYLMFYEECLKRVVEENTKYCPLAIKLSILISLAICVVIA